MKHLLFLVLLLPVVAMAQQDQNQGEIHSWGRNKGSILGNGTTVIYGTLPDTIKPVKLSKADSVWFVDNTANGVLLTLWDTIRIDTFKVRILRDYSYPDSVDTKDSTAKWSFFVVPIAQFEWVWKVRPVTRGYILCKPWYLEADKKKRIPNEQVWEKWWGY